MTKALEYYSEWKQNGMRHRPELWILFKWETDIGVHVDVDSKYLEALEEVASTDAILFVMLEGAINISCDIAKPEYVHRFNVLRGNCIRLRRELVIDERCINDLFESENGRELAFLCNIIMETLCPDINKIIE